MIEAAGGRHVVDALIPGGAGWTTSRGGRRWFYRNDAGVLGIVRVRIVRSRRDPGSLKFRIFGRHGNYAIAESEMPVKGTLVIDAPIARTGQCGEALFSGSSPSPHCAFNASGTALRCR